MTDKTDKSKLLNKEKDSFFHGPGMQKNWVIVNQKFLDYVGSKYGQSSKVSITAGKLVVTEIDKKILKKFKTKEEHENHMKTLNFWQQEEYLAAKGDYQKISRVIRTNLSSAYGDLFSLCDVTLRNRLEAEPDYQEMVEDGGCNVVILHKLVRKICNGSAAVMVDDVLGNMLEAMCNYMHIRGDDFPILSKYLESTKQRIEVLKESGFDIASAGIRDLCMKELESREQDSTVLHRTLHQWSLASQDGTADDAIRKGKDTLN